MLNQNKVLLVLMNKFYVCARRLPGVGEYIAKLQLVFKYLKNLLPVVHINSDLKDAIFEMSSKGLGLVAVTDDGGFIRGVITDGDLRRALQDLDQITYKKIADVMTANQIVIDQDALAIKGLEVMNEFDINSLLVSETNKKLVGALNIHILLRNKII